MQRGRVSLTMKDPSKPAAPKPERRKNGDKRKKQSGRAPEKSISESLGSNLGGIQVRRRKN
ncbi:hypothetical protein, partial [uncultured Ruminococcus sp.]|uniref:hypothetical protein n=1 Tax=uncultured Ruminococcus sp. TaxID=165186 RepID=UPI0026003EDB